MRIRPVSGKMTFVVTFPYFSRPPAYGGTVRNTTSIAAPHDSPQGVYAQGLRDKSILMDLEYPGVTPRPKVSGTGSRAM